MPAKSQVRRNLVGRVAITERHHPDSPDLPALRAELVVEDLAEYIQRRVASAPPLTDDQLTRLAVLLRPAG